MLCYGYARQGLTLQGMLDMTQLPLEREAI
jgi:hypothetical protein